MASRPMGFSSQSATPRPFAGRSIAAVGTGQEQRQRQPPPPPQVSSNEDYAGIPDEDREHIDEVFDLMDMKKKGYLNSYEFRHSLAALGFDLSKPQYYRELESYGTVPPDWQDRDCPVNRLHLYLDQFRLCASKLIAGRDPREEAAKVFAMFDYDQDGIISVDDMRHLAQDIKEDRSLTEEEILSMIDHLDHEGKGGVNLDEFMQMMEEAG
ncbi:EF hand family protein [Cordyceps fumosorosea ARSEF 2679]|uniref:EF hand family protein n=1 Tax=Cordyceps fumosorosea (strain ARSEF 2679) TaxID=1081104 RepID=A0A162JL21_CORFA|nr:EF hand family protein [Cordyceps fumosorosea ARSEF 2679]OAA70542.1 EF hand family protein [Cordyceps fumosorosea ARSEF 2679]